MHPHQAMALLLARGQPLMMALKGLYPHVLGENARYAPAQYRGFDKQHFGNLLPAYFPGGGKACPLQNRLKGAFCPYKFSYF